MQLSAQSEAFSPILNRKIERQSSKSAPDGKGGAIKPMKMNLASIKSQATIRTFNGWVSSHSEAELINNPIPCQHTGCPRFFMPDGKLFRQQWLHACFCSADHYDAWRTERQQELDNMAIADWGSLSVEQVSALTPRYTSTHSCSTHARSNLSAAAFSGL